jgi:hypothetical protein
LRIWTQTHLVLDQLLLTVNNPIVPFLVSDGYIASLEPSVWSDRIRSGSGIIQVSLHHIGAANPELPGLPGRGINDVVLVTSYETSFKVRKQDANTANFAEAVRGRK